jgi:hypothetical protein
MRKHATLLLAGAICFSMGIGAATADPDDSKKSQQNPDSIVTCIGLSGGYSVLWVTVPIPVNLDACAEPGPIAGAGGACSPCVRSLEEQGCKVVDATVTNVPPASAGMVGAPDGTGRPRASFLLSCEKP